MKFNILILMSLLFVVKAEAQNKKENAEFKLDVEIPSQKNNKLYFGYYWKGATYARDSVQLSTTGKGSLTINEELNPGQYFLYIKPDFQLDLLIDKKQDNIKLYIDEKDFSKSKVTGSNDTKELWAYLSEIQKREIETNKLREELADSTISQIRRTELQAQIATLKASTKSYTEQVLKNNPDTWFATFIKGTMPITLPYEQPRNNEEYNANKAYGRDHFFDNIDLKDSRLWYTNYLTEYIDSYLNQWVEQIPDTIADAASKLVTKTEGNEVCFKEMLTKLTNESLKSNVMGDENVWAKLYEDHILNKDILWIDSAQTFQLRKQYEYIKNNRIGMKAHNLVLQTIDGKTINTDEIEAKLTILYFYDPNCGHCKVSVPALHNKLYAKYKDKGLEIVAIDIASNTEQWKNFVGQHNLNDWINCADPEFKSQYWMYYDTSGVPVPYVLSKDKIILAKKIDEQNLEKLLDYYLKD